MKSFIFSITLFWSYLFFSICGLLGITYEGSSSSPIYTLGILVLAFISLVLVFTGDGLKLLFKNVLFTLLIPCFMLVDFLIEQNHTSIDITRYFIFYIALCMPSAFIGTYIARKGGVNYICKWLDLLMIVISLALLLSLPQIILNSSFENMIGGMSYQQTSYLSALSFGINLCGILFGERYKRFSFMNNFFVKLFCIILLFIQIMTCILSGGRGGFVLLFLTALLLMFFKYKANRMLIVIPTVLIAVILSISLFQKSLLSDVFETRSERTFNFVSESGLETHSRGDVWKSASKFIDENGFFGAGIFSYYSEFDKKYSQPYAHNLFLELLCQGGIVYCTFWVVLILLVMAKLPKVLKNQDNMMLLPLALFPIVYLMFTGSYLEQHFFWFVMAFVFNYKFEKTQMSSIIAHS